jgi:hypothetical protein
LAALHVSKGDTLYFTEAVEGYRVTPYDPDFERQMTVAQEVMRSDRTLLHELAKR